MNDLPRHAGPCPKCSYVRTPTDTVPPWQCPSCGVAYHKAAAAAKPAAEPARTRSATPVAEVAEVEAEVEPERRIPLKPILAAVVLVVGAVYGYVSWQQASAKEALEVQEAKARLQQIEQLIDELGQKRALLAAEAAAKAAVPVAESESPGSTGSAAPTNGN